MKLGKGLIVTGLLFYSVLGPMNIGNINAMAVDVQASESENEKETVNYNVIYSINGKTVTTKEAKELKLKDKFKSSENIREIKGKTLIKDFLPEYISLLNNKDGELSYAVTNKTVFVDIVLDKTSKPIYVNFINEKNETINDPRLNRSRNIFVGPWTDKVSVSSIALPKEYKAKDKDDIVIEKDQINVKLNKFDIINIKFIDQDNFKITDKNLLQNEFIVPEGTRIINSNDIKLPSNYRFIKDTKKYDINNNEIRVYVEEFKNVAIKYNVNGKSASIDGFVNMINVNVKARSISLDSIPNDFSNYKMKGNKKDFEIRNNQITIDLVTDPIDNPVKKPNRVKPGKVTNHKNPSALVKNYKGTISTHPNKTVSLYDSKGKAIKNRVLAGDSNWASDKTMELSGVKYYRVATNEWIKAENVYEYSASQSVVETSAGQFKNLFNSKGELATNRGLASGSRWLTDKTATINGEKMYRVATNEWLKASDIK